MRKCDIDCLCIKERIIFIGVHPFDYTRRYNGLSSSQPRFAVDWAPKYPQLHGHGLCHVPQFHQLRKTCNHGFSTRGEASIYRSAEN